MYICMSNEGLISIVFFMLHQYKMQVHISVYLCIDESILLYCVCIEVYLYVYIYIYKRIYSRVLIYSKWHKYFLIIFCLCFPLAEENRRFFLHSIGIIIIHPLFLSFYIFDFWTMHFDFFFFLFLFTNKSSERNTP